ncbi:glycosyltransferase involved in cell wall biosynthesis [Acholeplasma morum]|uniref:glycosyltransferase n=1 Tax=Paracholeplasma morum TaxID=264637 RepID=UPI00195636D9|nr:glycosyltransferase [Paracholeplasma morum]MBM7453034.1 glycosyltransferase involved in cell wall biosynthesis [Paracholeplasma morum]
MDFSVLMSLYDKDNEDYLVQSIESLLNQTVLANEIVLVIDGPINQKLQNIVNFYSIRYKDLFKIIQLPENMGLGKALDQGIFHCTNEYVARMDADDISLPNRFEKQVEFIEKNPDIDIFGAIIDEFNENGEVVSTRTVPLTDKEIKKYIRRRSPFNHPTVFFKKSKVILFGGYGNLGRKQDYDLFSRMLMNDCKGANLNESLLLFRSDNNSFKRRKSIKNAKSYVRVARNNYSRGYCSLNDLVFVICSQILAVILPIWVFKIITKKFLRK